MLPFVGSIMSWSRTGSGQRGRHRLGKSSKAFSEFASSCDFCGSKGVGVLPQETQEDAKGITLISPDGMPSLVVSREISSLRRGGDGSTTVESIRVRCWHEMCQGHGDGVFADGGSGPKDALGSEASEFSGSPSPALRSRRLSRRRGRSRTIRADGPPGRAGRSCPATSPSRSTAARRLRGC